MDQKSYCLHQKEIIERAKWLEGERLGYDPGPEFVERWVKENAAKYREEYRKEFAILVKKVASSCRLQLEKIVPGVSSELWDVVFKVVIENFTAIWTREIVVESNEERKMHLEEI